MGFHQNRKYDMAVMKLLSTYESTISLRVLRQFYFGAVHYLCT